MGDVALIIFHEDKKHFSPVVYLHWAGGRVREFLENSSKFFKTGDSSYSAARFIGYCHTQIEGNVSLGVFNSPENTDEIYDEEFSHGDAGVFLVDVNEWEVEAFNGYGIREIANIEDAPPTPSKMHRFQLNKSLIPTN